MYTKAYPVLPLPSSPPAGAIAILIPLYRPESRHLLLLKSVLSACRGVPNVIIFVAADGHGSNVTWPAGFIDKILSRAASAGHRLHIYSFLQSAGYPECYQRLLEDALVNSEVTMIHFVDQDDYCLPNRFVGRVGTLSQASSVIVVDQQFGVIAERRFDSEQLIALLETPAPGMTFSIPRSVAEKYLSLCRETPLAANAPHDYVIAQISNREGTLQPSAAASMLYIQHNANAIGYVVGIRWMLRTVGNFLEVIRRTSRNAALLDLLYGGRHWAARNSLHRSRVKSLLYRIVLMFT